MIKFETNSKKVLPGQTFVAIKGHTVDGHDYIDEAIKNGAIEVVVSEDVTCDVPIIKVEDTEKYLNEALVSTYSEAFSKLKLIGITGTNGKTTTCYLTYQLLKSFGVKVAYMGTIGFYFEEQVMELPNTTPDILTIYKLFTSALESGCTTIVMEVSSHSIAYGRIAGLNFMIGGFTNLTEDHLDFHKTMANYLETKLEFLDYVKGPFIVNADDEYAPSFIQKGKNIKTISLNTSDYQIKDYSFSPDKTTITFSYDGKDFTFTSNLTGKFNVYNMMFAVIITHLYGFSLDDILKKVKHIYPPKGRCETYKVKDFYAVVDYAHTPDAVEKVIDCYQELAKAKIITVVGCGGDRDPLKRPIMGRIASSKSDYVIFTSDNPRTEDPKKIMDDIIKGVKNDNYEIILDRKEAIKKALTVANTDDIVLILGKGHEDYQIIGHEKIHLDDAEEIKKFIESE